MKNTITALVSLILLFTTSCTKTSSNPGGSWTFQSVTYPVKTCTLEYQLTNTLLANDPTSTTLNQLQCNFSNGLPTSSNTYVVVSTLPMSSNQINIGLSLSSGDYNCLGNGQTVNVSVSNGKVSISGNGILMDGNNALTFNITQTQ